MDRSIIISFERLPRRAVGRDVHVIFRVESGPTATERGYLFGDYASALAEGKRFLEDMTDEEANVKAGAR